MQDSETVGHRREIGTAAIGAFAFLALGQARSAWAGDGSVLSIEGTDLYVDLGRADGVREGLVLDVQRVVQIVHPRTKRAVLATFPLGQATVVLVHDAMTVVRMVGQVRWPPQIGDRVQPPAAPTPTARPVAAVGPAGAAAPAGVVAGRRHPALDLLGLPLADRIRRLDDLLRQEPDAPEAAVLRRELDTLQAILAEVRVRAAETAPRESAERAIVPSTPRPSRALVYHRPPRVALAGRPLSVVVSAWPTERVGGGVLHWVGADGHLYATAMRAAGGPHLRAEIPAGAVRPPSVAYFIEVMPQGGGEPDRSGSVDAPLRVNVPAPAPERLAPPPRDRTEIGLRSEYADFNGFNAESPGQRHDWIVAFEGFLLYRLRGRVLHAVRMGYGVLRGEGGSIAEIDGPMPRWRPVGFDFGFYEMEMRMGPVVSGIGRLSVGSGGAGLGAGVAGYLRFGTEESTNLVAGASTTPEIGEVFAVRLTWRVIPAVQIVGAVEVTDQPVRGPNWGVRLLTEVGWNVAKWAQIDLRVGYNGRNLSHTGPSLGGGVTLRW